MATELGHSAVKGYDLSITRESYEAFASGQLDRWDALIAPDMVLHSTLGRDMRGLAPLKAWASAFHTAFRPRIDLLDEFSAHDRAVFTVNLHWYHTAPFFGVPPTGQSGTSIESFILRLEDGKVIEWLVADQTLDLVVYLAGQGMPYPRGVAPVPLVAGSMKAEPLS